MASGRFPAWTVVRPVLGTVLALVLVMFVVGRATGLIGDATSTGAATSAVPDRSAEISPGHSAAAEPPDAPGETEGADDPEDPDDEAADPDRRRDREKDRGRGDEDGKGRGAGAASWADDSSRDDELLSRVEELLEEEATPPARFRVGSLNVLGASHTSRGGNKPAYASGTQRIGWIAQLLQQHDIDVVGLQEYEPVQHQAFMRRAGARFEVFPGLQVGRNAVRNSIAWQRATWDAVSTHTVPIPYFRGKRVPMPYVLLEHRESGRRVWFINIHNPVSSPRRGNNERWRDLGTSLQIGLMQRLHAETGHPVILMGDFNEREEAFCAVTRRAPAVAANGGSAGPPCRPPANLGIDWIFGTTDIVFSGYNRMRGGIIGRATDHPVLVSDAEISGSSTP